MPSAITLKRKNQRKRTLSGEQRPQTRAIPIGIVSVDASASTLTIVFNQPVLLKGIPLYTHDGGAATPTAATLTAPNTLALTYAAPVTGTATVQVPFEDPAIRNASGGYVAPSNFTV